MLFRLWQLACSVHLLLGFDAKASELEDREIYIVLAEMEGYLSPVAIHSERRNSPFDLATRY